MAKSAVFIDLDRTLLCRASGQILNRALVDEGVLPEGRSLPGDKLLYAVNDRLGENLFSMGLVRAAARVARGWQQEQVQAAGRRAVSALSEIVAPFAPQRLAAFRAEGHRLVLSTTTPADMIAPFAEAIGFDDLIATAYETKDGRYTGRLYEGFVWGTGKLRAVRGLGRRATGSTWPTATPAATASSTCRCSSSVGTPHAVNPDPSLTLVATARRWPVEHWDRPPGVPSVVGLEPYHMLRPFVRKLSFPYARFDIAGVEHVPDSGPVLLAANHRSYFDVAALALVARDIGRPVRFLGKKEIFDAPVVGTDRPGHRRHRGRPRQRIGRAAAGRRVRAEGGRGGDRPPAGHHPAGYDFFDPVLHGKTGTARLAASTGATVVPVGLWGTEKVWPRSARVPDFTLVRHPPTVTVRVGRPGAAVAHRRQGGHRRHHGGHHRAAAPRGQGAPRADRRGAGPQQAPSVRAQLASATTRVGQRHVASPRARPGHRGRRPGRPPARPPAARAPERGPPGRARHGHQREDHDDTGC